MVAEVCHESGKPLIVDEAWGAHLPFHPQLPSGLAAGMRIPDPVDPELKSVRVVAR